MIVERKIPVFIEKPFAANSADAEAIAQMANEKDTPVMTGPPLRYSTAFEQLEQSPS